MEVCRSFGKDGLFSLYQSTQNVSISINSNYLDIRKLAAKVICELAYKEKSTQEYLCNSFGVTPLHGKVCINKMPNRIIKQIEKDPRVIIDIKKEPQRYEDYWCFPPVEVNEMKFINKGNHNELIRNFPDPMDYWIGFTLAEETNKHKKNSTIIETARRNSISNPFADTANKKLNTDSKDNQSLINKLAVSPGTVKRPTTKTAIKDEIIPVEVCQCSLEKFMQNNNTFRNKINS